jgi:hypothetical protein
MLLLFLHGILHGLMQRERIVVVTDDRRSETTGRAR